MCIHDEYDLDNVQILEREQDGICRNDGINVTASVVMLLMITKASPPSHTPLKSKDANLYNKS
jgi:hypothetical protein